MGSKGRRNNDLLPTSWPDGASGCDFWCEARGGYSSGHDDLLMGFASTHPRVVANPSGGAGTNTPIPPWNVMDDGIKALLPGTEHHLHAFAESLGTTMYALRLRSDQLYCSCVAEPTRSCKGA